MQWADTPVDVATKVYFDLETSGLRPDRGARITEIAVVGPQETRLHWQWAKRNEERPVGGDGYDRTLTPQLARLLGALQEGVVVGHNLAFDFDFLAYEIARLRSTGSASVSRTLRGARVRLRFVDTLALARRIIDGSGYELGALLDHVGATPDEPLHTALGDAFATRALFERLTDHPEISTLADAGLQKLSW